MTPVPGLQAKAGGGPERAGRWGGEAGAGGGEGGPAGRGRRLRLAPGLWPPDKTIPAARRRRVPAAPSGASREGEGTEAERAGARGGGAPRSGPSRRSLLPAAAKGVRSGRRPASGPSPEPLQPGPSGAYSAVASRCGRRRCLGSQAASCGSGFGGGESTGRGRGGIRSDRSRPGLSGASPSCSGSYSCCRYCSGSASRSRAGARTRASGLGSRAVCGSRARCSPPPPALPALLPRPWRRGRGAGRGGARECARGVGVGIVFGAVGLGARARGAYGREG